METEPVAFETPIAGFDIRVERSNHKLYTVTYGKQVRPFLDYTEAAHALGECIFHALQCEGKLHDE